MAIQYSCTWIGLLIILIGSIGNWFCICVFCRKRFRSSMLTPFFIALLIADFIYLTFRVTKLLYYQQTLFHNLFNESSCSSSFLVQIYGYLTQYAPQLFIPFFHYEFYIRFSLLLMAFLALQRAYDIFHTSYIILSKNSTTRCHSYILILSAFILSYLFEFFGLSIFCSYELSTTVACDWYNYLHENLSNETIHLIRFIKSQTDNSTEIDCIINNSTYCTQQERMKIIRYYFDMHQRPIVSLIQKIQLSTIGQKMARNELRLKYHYHTCLIRFNPDFFLKIYNLLYSRILGFNRYTIILVVGSIIPSIATIVANTISLRCILAIRHSITKQSRASRRRTEETRRVIIIITTECLLAIINSWFVDIILSIKYCHRSVAIGDDCPHFLRRSQALLALCDVLNSMSNIILYCFAGKRFRQELKRMFQSWLHPITKRVQCYCRVEFKKATHHMGRNYDAKQHTPQTDSSTKPSKMCKYPNERKHEFIKLRVVTRPTHVL